MEINDRNVDALANLKPPFPSADGTGPVWMRDSSVVVYNVVGINHIPDLPDAGLGGHLPQGILGRGGAV